MNKIINSRQAVCGTVWAVCLCIIIALWPLRLVTEKVVSGSNRQISMRSEAVTEEYVVGQMFVAQYDHLQNIRVYFLNEAAGEEFNFVLRDASGNILMQQVISTDDMQEMPGFCTIRVNQETEVGREYYYAIQGISSDLYVAYEDTETSGTIYNGTLYYGNVEDTEHNIITEYEYKVPLRKGRTLVCDALLVVFGILVTYIAGQYYKKHPDRNRLLTVEAVWKRIATPVIVIAAALSAAAVWPCKLFSPYAENNLFFIAGILITAGILLYGVHHERLHKSGDMGLAKLRDRWTDYLQAAFLAMAIQAGVHYMNGLYEIHHMIAYREMLIYFGLAVIATYKRKELLNWGNLAYLAIAAFVGHAYYRNQLVSPEMVMPGTEEGIQVVKLTVWAGIIAGIVILNTICGVVNEVRRLRTDRMRGARSFSFWYGAVLAVFFALLIAFRNTRGWPVYLVCAFSLYYARAAVWEKKDRLLQNVCNGILLHFLVMTGYCLLHRPYMFYRYYRYPFVFHTVTICAVYLALVVCAALVKLLGCYRREQKFSCVWKEWTVFGISVVYLIFTLSRTGYLAVAIMALVVIPVVCLGMKKKVKSLISAAALMILAVLLCFPAVFTAQRIIPAVSAQPERMEIEELPSEIEHGRDLDSNYYMTLRRFIHVFQSKVLSIPDEECINQYKTAKADTVILVASADLSGSEIPMQEEEPADEEQGEEEEQTEGEEQQESDAEAYTNGRLDIFKLYYENLNREGHDEMGITLPDGNLIVHAHNIYLQVAYDHGVPVGIVFILFGFSTLIQSARYYRRRKNDRLCSALPLALLILFAAAGLTEWIFHPCNPIAFCLLLMPAPLLTDMGRTAEGTGRDGEEA
ncbi:MAG: hypothetical protein NC341_04445 [Blautia sp.]|nr:hypothetical protein [Blautia sp.]MCM1200886.1 hypothetical protein [Bacteroides fragilis]